jgi:hypothetical protein
LSESPDSTVIESEERENALLSAVDIEQEFGLSQRTIRRYFTLAEWAQFVEIQNRDTPSGFRSIRTVPRSIARAIQRKARYLDPPRRILIPTARPADDREEAPPDPMGTGDAASSGRRQNRVTARIELSLYGRAA